MGKDFDGVQAKRAIATGFLLVEIVPGGKLLKPVTKGLKSAEKLTVVGSRNIFTFVGGSKKVLANYDEAITVTKWIEGSINQVVDVIDNAKFKNKNGVEVEDSLEFVTQGDDVGALIIKEAGLFDTGYPIRVANTPDKIMPFVTKYANELTRSLIVFNMQI